VRCCQDVGSKIYWDRVRQGIHTNGSCKNRSDTVRVTGTRIAVRPTSWQCSGCARHDKVVQRWQFGIICVNQGFEYVDCIIRELRGRGLILCSRRNVAENTIEFALNSSQSRANFGIYNF
jgi:hypothetical protein